MTDSVFTDYFDKTIWSEGAVIPSEKELMDMEQAFIGVLEEQKNSRHQDGSYKYLYSTNGKKIISRITFCNAKYNDGTNTPELKRLYSSYTRLREALKAMDRTMYERELRSSIQKGKKQARSVSRVAQVSSSEVAQEPIQVVVPVVEKTPSAVISGTQGLADYLGCGKSMAFSIIKNGVLKDNGIQYMVGKCWKFNREKLDKYLTEHPELLSKVRCKR